MPTQRYTQAARRRDLHLYQLLLAGFPEENVARTCNVSLADVFAATQRIEGEWSLQGPQEVVRQRFLLMCNVLIAQSMEAWQVSLVSKPLSDQEMIDGKSPKFFDGNPRHLDRVVRVMMMQLRFMTKFPAPDTQPDAALSMLESQLETQQREELQPEQHQPAEPQPTERAVENGTVGTPRPSLPAAKVPAADELLPAHLFANPPQRKPAIPPNVIADVCSRAFGGGLTPLMESCRPR